ncbi:MAG: helix-turn-helix domain-containing protein [Lentisphaerae bacterium]|nr:helix-turn-helix domain-containing protein [Lentisphaerota bacterium]
MTQQDVALRLGCFRTRVGKWEQREVRIDILDFVRLCTIYKLNLNRLLAELRVKDPPCTGGSFFYLSRVHSQNARPLVTVGAPYNPLSNPRPNLQSFVAFRQWLATFRQTVARIAAYRGRAAPGDNPGDCAVQIQRGTRGAGRRQAPRGAHGTGPWG